MRRPATLLAVWLAGTVAATTVAWSAVDLVGRSVTDRVTRPLSAGAVERQLDREPSPLFSPAATQSAAASPATRAPATRTPVAPASRRPTGPAAAPRTGTGGTGGAGGTPSTRPGSASAHPSLSGPPPSATPPPATTTRTFGLTGGGAAVSCSGATAALVYASPKAGYEVEVESRGPVEVEVRFRSSSHESRLNVECDGGVPTGRVEERTR